LVSKRKAEVFLGVVSGGKGPLELGLRSIELRLRGIHSGGGLGGRALTGHNGGKKKEEVRERKDLEKYLIGSDTFFLPLGTLDNNGASCLNKLNLVADNRRTSPIDPHVKPNK
jgi:hypothetical protein